MRAGERAGELITRCWEHFAELVPDEIANAIVAMAERPALLAEPLHTWEPTLLHGDVRLNNLGFRGDRVVLVDWGERTGSAPAPVELASFLILTPSGSMRPATTWSPTSATSTATDSTRKP